MQKVVIDPERIVEYSESFESKVDVEFPELREFLGMADNEMPVLKIKAASLNDQVRAQTLYEQAAIVAVRMMEWASNQKGRIDPVGFDQFSKELREPMNAKTHLEISLFHRCVIDPEFTMRQSVRISEALPEVVNRVASKALELSSLQRTKT
jgi:hypothetical protein